MFSVCVVTYGDYPDLISRVLASLKQHFHGHIKDIRIGLNAVSEDSFDCVMRWSGSLRHCPVYVYQEVDNENVGKYPLMRRMFSEEPAVFDTSEFIMWLDDDSYFDGVTDNWWNEVYRSLRINMVVGLRHYISARGNQAVGIAEQPWYTGKEIPKRHRFEFATGAWWAARSSFIKMWDYPFPEVYHNGGDSILGELCRQQDASIGDFKEGAQCHARCCYKGTDRGNVVHVNVGGREGRRGMGKKSSEEVYPWHFHGEKPQSYEAHNFDLKVFQFDGVH
jgi:hypothetical protein